MSHTQLSKCRVPLNPIPRRQCTDLELINVTLTPSESSVLYVLTARNNGPVDARNVILNVTFEGPLQIIFPGDWTQDGNTVRFNLGNIAVGSTFASIMQFAVNSSSTVIGTVSASTPDCNRSNNTATASYQPLNLS